MVDLYTGKKVLVLVDYTRVAFYLPYFFIEKKKDLIKRIELFDQTLFHLKIISRFRVIMI